MSGAPSSSISAGHRITSLPPRDVASPVSFLNECIVGGVSITDSKGVDKFKAACTRYTISIGANQIVTVDVPLGSDFTKVRNEIARKLNFTHKKEPAKVQFKQRALDTYRERQALRGRLKADSTSNNKSPAQAQVPDKK